MGSARQRNSSKNLLLGKKGGGKTRRRAGLIMRVKSLKKESYVCCVPCGTGHLFREGGRPSVRHAAIKLCRKGGEVGSNTQGQVHKGARWGGHSFSFLISDGYFWVGEKDLEVSCFHTPGFLTKRKLPRG